METEHAVMNLSALAPGKVGKVTSVGGKRLVALRLMEMGLIEGTTLRLVRRAPMGDPLELRLRGYALSIRAADAKHVMVEVTESR